MDNVLNNYQPDNRIFWDMFMAVLCFVCSIFYTTYKLQDQGDLLWYDWSILGVLLSTATILLKRVARRQRS